MKLLGGRLRSTGELAESEAVPSGSATSDTWSLLAGDTAPAGQAARGDPRLRACEHPAAVGQPQCVIRAQRLLPQPLPENGVSAVVARLYRPSGDVTKKLSRFF